MINLSICVRYFRFQKSIYVLHPLLVPDLIREFDKYYRTFPTKEVVFYYDDTMTATSATSNLSYADEVQLNLEKYGWNVEMVNLGHTPSPYARYLLWGVPLPVMIPASCSPGSTRLTTNTCCSQCSRQASNNQAKISRKTRAMSVSCTLISVLLLTSAMLPITFFGVRRNATWQAAGRCLRPSF